MTRPLGDRLIQWSAWIFAVCFGLGWISLLLVMLIQKLFPSLEKKSEEILQTIAKFLRPIVKYSLIAVGVLLLVELLASWLGWIE